MVEPFIAIGGTIGAILMCQIITWGFVKIKHFVIFRYRQWRAQRKDKNARRPEEHEVQLFHEVCCILSLPIIAGLGNEC